MEVGADHQAGKQPANDAVEPFAVRDRISRHPGHVRLTTASVSSPAPVAENTVAAVTRVARRFGTHAVTSSRTSPAACLRVAGSSDDVEVRRVERERRFIVSKLPPEEPWARRSITDLYIAGTRLRVRRVEGVVDGRPELVHKLTQKVPDPAAQGGRRGQITTIHLDQTEYRLLSTLPGDRLTKTRLSFPPMGVDVFDGVLAGLLLAEAEFTDDAMTDFVPPPWCGQRSPRIPTSPACTLHTSPTCRAKQRPQRSRRRSPLRGDPSDVAPATDDTLVDPSPGDGQARQPYARSENEAPQPQHYR